MTKIQWTDETWNPVTGCTKVSTGCKHCYAERDFPRAYRNPRADRGRMPDGSIPPDGPRSFTDLRLHPGRLDYPLHWRKPRRVFVNSMSDLFHEDVPDGFIDSVFAVMALAKRHTFQVLTKRSERMAEYLAGNGFAAARGGPMRDRVDVAAITVPTAEWRHGNLPPPACHRWPLPNVWLGVSCEDQETADGRIPLLLDTPAAVRFVSAEPLLGPIDFARIAGAWHLHGGTGFLEWVIVGGESGPKARPCDVGWIRSIVEDCRKAKVACFVKQLGRSYHDGTEQHRRIFPTDRKGGDPVEWPEDLRVREWPA